MSMLGDPRAEHPQVFDPRKIVPQNPSVVGETANFLGKKKVMHTIFFGL